MAMIAWLDYLDARRRLIHEWHAAGVSAEDAALRIEIDAAHAQRIIEQLADPPLPGSSRALVAELRQRVAALEAELARRDSMPPPSARIHVPSRSQIRALLSHADPAKCGCQFFADSDGTTTPETHHPECIFAQPP